jgi:hypothetical protein
MSNHQRIQVLFCATLCAVLEGCNPTTGVASPTNNDTSFLFTLPSVWTEMTTRTETQTETPFSLTATATRTFKATKTALPTSTLTAIPTQRPTPTRGLPPTATLSPKETCPPPTYVKVEFHFEYSVADYGTQILEYFRATGDRAGLKEQLEKLGKTYETTDPKTGVKHTVLVPNSAQFSEADLTGDLVKETIIILKQSDSEPIGRPGMGVFIVGCRANQYQLLGSFDTYYSLDQDDSAKVMVRDLNADGIGEIIISAANNTGSAHGDVSFYATVFEWERSSFRNLMEPQDNGYRPAWIGSFNRPLEFQDIDGNGTLELLFPDEFFAPYCGLGPYRLKKAIYMWDGEYYRYMWTDPGAPQYRFQAAFDGDYYAWLGLYDKSEKMYQQALDDSTLKAYFKENPIGACSTPPVANPDEPQQIIAYTRFRNLELHVNLQKLSDAENDWEYLETNYPPGTPGYLFATFAKTFWEAYQTDNNIDTACLAVKDMAGLYEKERFGLMYYGDLNPGPTLVTICPFHSMSDG